MRTIGVYRILNTLTKTGYIGGSIAIEKRWSHHKVMLEREVHACKPLQEAWNTTPKKFWKWEILVECSKEMVKIRETRCIKKTLIPLYNLYPGATAKGFRHTKETKKAMSNAAILVADYPGERKRRSKRAKEQHKNGNFGRATWKPGTAELVAKKIGDAHRGKPGNTGWKHTKEYKRHMSKLMSGKGNHRFGKKASPETLEKMKKSQQERRIRESLLCVS